MINEDIIEGVIALPEKLFFGTGIPACVLILNRNKPRARKNKIMFIYAAKEYLEGKNRNKLREPGHCKDFKTLSSLQGR